MNENNIPNKNNILLQKSNYNYLMNKNRSRNILTEENLNNNNENNNNLLLNNLSLKTPKIEKSFIDKMIEEDNIKYLKYNNKNNSEPNSYNFGRKKIDFNKIIKENIFREEKPTFSDENDRNIDYLNDFMKKKNKIIEYNNQNYLNYMKKIRHLPKINELKERNKKRIKDNIGKLNFFFKDNEDNQNQKINNIYKKINNNNIKFNNNIYNNDYYKEYKRYRQEQKKYLDYNQNVMINNYNKHLKSKYEINVNPYHDYYKNNLGLGKSVLKHNPILNPQPYTGYQNYFSNDNINNYSFSHRRINYDEILNNINNNKENKTNNKIEDIINNNKYEEKSEKIYNSYKNIF